MLDSLKAGDVLEGRYELITFIGEGGFARVWRARDRHLGREVAIKLLNLSSMMLGQQASVDIVLQRFEREARLAASIHHPNVVQIHDIGNLEGHRESPFIVMELLTGDDLKARIDEHGPCDPTTFLPQFINCLDGLARAHALGIVHKDLKPSNLFLSDPGRRTETLKLVDFGIAHISQPSPEDAAARLTSTGQLLGTPQYLPPEYIHSQHVSPAMDVYQMSLVLIEALTAEYVLGGESSLQCLIIHGDGRLEIPRYLLESPLGAVLKHGLCRDPASRYNDAHEFAEALSAIPPEHVPRRPDTQGQALERIRLDGSKLTQGTPNVSLAPSLFMESGVVPGQVPGRHAGRRDTPDAYMHTVDSASSMPSAARLPPASQPHAEALPSPAPPPRITSPQAHPPAQAPTFTPSQMHAQPGRPAGQKSSNTFNVLILVCVGLGLLAAGCVCCAAFSGEVEEDANVEYEDVYSEQTNLEAIAPAVLQAPPEVAAEEVDTIEATEPVLGGHDWAVRAAAIALQVEEATQMLEHEQPEEAITLCDGLIRKVAGTSLEVVGCYNVILRASWNPTTPFDEPDRRACTMLKGYLDAYPKHAVSIGVQRSILKCVEHDL